MSRILEASIIPTYNSRHAKTNRLPSDLLTSTEGDHHASSKLFRSSRSHSWRRYSFSSFHYFHRQAVATQAGLLAYCASTPDQSDIYISQIFNTGFNPAVSQDSNPIQNEYNEYLKGRFDVKSNSNFPVACPLFLNMSEAQSRKQNYEMQVRQGNKHIVQLEWNYRPESGTAIAPTAAIPQHRMPRVNTAQADHTFCISDVYQNTVYVTGPVATPPPVAMNLWANGFTDFLKGKYSFQGRVYCNMGTAESGQRLVDAHLDGSRAAGRSLGRS